MKIKFLSLLVACTLFSAAAFCQKFNFGIKAGTDLHKIQGKSFDEEFKFGYNVGAYAEVKVKKIGIQPEIYFSQVNARTGTGISDLNPTGSTITKIKLSYLNIPILANLYFNPNVALQVGPQVGILVNQDVSLYQNGVDAFKKGDFSLVGGLQIKILKFRVFGRYVVGLNDKNDIKNTSSSEKWKSQTIHLGIGYTIL